MRVRGDAALVGAVTLVVVLVVLAPVLLAPATRALGSPCSEAPQHLWSLWLVSDHLWTDGPLVRRSEMGFPEGFVEHLMDPVSLLPFVPVHRLVGGTAGAILGWNALHLALLGVAGWGCLRLGRALDLGPAGTGALAAAFVGSTPLFMHALTARSECLAFLLLPACLALLREAIDRDVAGEGARGRALAAGALLGLLALGGAYAAIFTAPVVVLVSLAWTGGRPWARWRVVLPTAALGALGAGVAAAATLRWPPTALHVQPSLTQAVSQPLAALVRLGDPVMGAEPLVYPGLVVGILAVVGAALRPRRALGWLLLGAALVAVAVGPLPWLGDTRYWGPAALLVRLVPPLEQVMGWTRAGYLTALPLGVAAAHGVAALGARLSGRGALALGGALAALALVDQATWPATGVGRDERALDPALPADLAAVLADLPPGAIMEVPLASGAAPGVCLPMGTSMLWARQHGRPTTAVDTARQDAWRDRSWILRQVAGRADVLAARVGERERACARADLHALREAGVAALVLHRGRPFGPSVGALVEALLGAPTVQRGEHAAWDLAALDPGPEAAPCR